MEGRTEHTRFLRVTRREDALKDARWRSERKHMHRKFQEKVSKNNRMTEDDMMWMLKGISAHYVEVPRGGYTSDIITLDFASLYPSAMK